MQYLENVAIRLQEGQALDPGERVQLGFLLEELAMFAEACNMFEEGDCQALRFATLPPEINMENYDLDQLRTLTGVNLETVEYIADFLEMVGEDG